MSPRSGFLLVFIAELQTMQACDMFFFRARQRELSACES